MKEKPSRDDLIELVRKIIHIEGSEDQIDEWINVLEANVPHPRVTDCIYYPERDMSPEEIVDVAMNYRPIGLLDQDS